MNQDRLFLCAIGAFPYGFEALFGIFDGIIFVKAKSFVQAKRLRAGSVESKWCQLTPSAMPDVFPMLKVEHVVSSGVIPVERAMAVGDGTNDIELMEAAGFSVAMGNAVDAVRRVAGTVTEDCDHDGAAKAALRYMLGICDT